jgi:1-deoxy-D-xylulose-5-phosphate reductoisomerase
MKRKSITILGATGSIGLQTLNVIESLPDRFELNYVTINKNISELENICKKFNPKGVVIADESSYKTFKKQTSYKGEILCGSENIIFAASDSSNDILLSSLVGFSGVTPTYEAIKKGITIALANKETLVSAGRIIMYAAKAYNAKILAVDSEHSAILQCLAGEDYNSIEKIILTASGGPFRIKPIEEFHEISISQALNHPNWSMGSKITIDSATMMNKGFEVIEARWLFDLEISKIDVVIHPQSIIHSLVQFDDGSVKAQLGMPDMRMPISYALTYPERLKYNFPRINLLEISKLEFHEPDLNKFPCLKLAYQALESDGNAPAILNAANEICVAAFLEGKIKFIEIAQIIEQVLGKIEHISNPTLDLIINTDNETRTLTSSIIYNKN